MILNGYFAPFAKSSLGDATGRLEGPRPVVTSSEGTVEMPGHAFNHCACPCAPGGRRSQLFDLNGYQYHQKSMKITKNRWKINENHQPPTGFYSIYWFCMAVHGLAAGSGDLQGSLRDAQIGTMVKRMPWHVHSDLGWCYDRPGPVQTVPNTPNDDLAKGAKYPLSFYLL